VGTSALLPSSNPTWISTIASLPVAKLHATTKLGTSSPGTVAQRKSLAMLVRATVTMMTNAPMTWFVEKTTAQLSSRPSLERTNQIAAKSLEQLTGSLKDTKSVMVSASRERETVIGTAIVSKAWFVITAGDWERISALPVGIQLFH